MEIRPKCGKCKKFLNIVEEVEGFKSYGPCSYCIGQATKEAVRASGFMQAIMVASAPGVFALELQERLNLDAKESIEVYALVRKVLLNANGDGDRAVDEV